MRRGPDRVSDFRTSGDVTVPATATRITVGYRIVTARPIGDCLRREPLMRGRFSLEVHQRLPYQPIDGGMLNVPPTARTLFHENQACSTTSC